MLPILLATVSITQQKKHGIRQNHVYHSTLTLTDGLPVTSGRNYWRQKTLAAARLLWNKKRDSSYIFSPRVRPHHGNTGISCMIMDIYPNPVGEEEDMVNRSGDADDQGYIPDEDDPDYQFSEAAGYAGWEPPERRWLRPLLLVVSLLVLAAMLVPLLLYFAR